MCYSIEWRAFCRKRSADLNVRTHTGWMRSSHAGTTALVADSATAFLAVPKYIFSLSDKAGVELRYIVGRSVSCLECDLM